MNKRLEASIDDTIIKEREVQIQKIQQDMETMKELFDQMANLVEIQGPDVIQISQNLKTTEEKVDDGVEELQKAYDQRRICIIL